MLPICLFFQIHQPLRVRPYSVFEIGKHTPYFDQAENRRILAQTCEDSYDPSLRILEKLILSYGQNFKVSLSISGTALEQLEAWQPQVLERLKRLAKTGAVEFLSETYYHSFAFEYSRPEFLRQILLHTEKIESVFGQKPRVFKNSSLLFHNPMAYFLKQQGYKGIMTEAAPQILHGRHPNRLFHSVHLPDFALLLRNAGLSEDLGFRFSDKDWEHYPLTGDSFADIISRQEGDSICLGMDLAQMGNYHSSESGIFEFLADFPGKLIARGHTFMTASELIDSASPGHSLDVPYPISWGGDSKDENFAMGNSRQQEALRKIYEMESMVMESKHVGLIQDWSYLQASDHFQNMNQQVSHHARFEPQENDSMSFAEKSYTHFLNLVADFQISLREL